MVYVEVAVNSGLPQRQAFSYAVPEGMSLQPGDAVFVPFGRRYLQGIVIDVAEVPSFADPKPVDARMGDAPVIRREHVELACWIAGYYLAPLFSAVALMLPPGFERKPLTRYESLLRAEELDAARLPPRQRGVIEYLVQRGSAEVKDIERDVKQKGVAASLSQLVQRGLVRRSYSLARPSVRAKIIRYVYLRNSPDTVLAGVEALGRKRKGRLAKALQLLLDAPAGLPASELRLRAGATLPLLRPLAEEGLIEVRDEPVERDPLAGRDFQRRDGPALTREQESAYKAIEHALESPHPSDRLRAGSFPPLGEEGTGGPHPNPLPEGEGTRNGPAESARLDGDSGPKLTIRGAQDEREQGFRSRTFLLHGVTGSGKTEVYLRALDKAIALGKRAIVLVPEIALTPQTVRRFAERFPGQVAVLHSGLSQGELFDQWHGIRDGRYAVVIGSRSAIFAPQPNLGLIVIDEEHEWTYKQNEPAPRYDARRTAEKLAELTGAVLVLGSATPDVVSYQRALWGQSTLLELKERVRPVFSGLQAVGITSTRDMPPVDVVDMREELKSGNRSIFSRSLQLGLYQALENGEQAILFLNRRGTAGFVQCRDCGFVPQCSACAIALSYHRHIDKDGIEVERLLCHQCNRGRRPYSACPMCGGARLRPMGLGVERVEEALRELLPEARTLRWDRDVTQGRNAHEQILSSFVKGEADVLIGTQMVAKGLDLPAVTLVGVISADIGLHIPDFRSAERTFQLLTQVAGRAGRAVSSAGGPPPGLVVIQTYTPDNYAIAAAAEHDYSEFFAAEVELRRQQAYPPFVRLARLIYSHSNPERAERNAERMVRHLRQSVAQRGLPGVTIVEAAPPHIPKWHGRYRWQITVRSPDPVELLQDVSLPEGWVLDIDPASLA
jgi:primosomal protein N' (replication factor Y)